MRLPLALIASLTILTWACSVVAQPYHTLLICPDDTQHRAGADRVVAVIRAAGHYATLACGGERRECVVTVMVGELEVVGPLARQFVERERLHFTRSWY